MNLNPEDANTAMSNAEDVDPFDMDVLRANPPTVRAASPDDAAVSSPFEHEAMRAAERIAAPERPHLMKPQRGKPFRIHPDRAARYEVSLITVSVEYAPGRFRTAYGFVPPRFHGHVQPSAKVIDVELVYGLMAMAERPPSPFFWPAPISTPGLAETSRKVIEAATVGWVEAEWSRRQWTHEPTRHDLSTVELVWPTVPEMAGLLGSAFGANVVDRFDHPLLRGEVS